MAPPGYFHSPQIHNYLENYHPDSKTVTSEDAVKFKAYMTSDQYDFNRSRPTHPPYYDKDMNFAKDRSYFLSLILFGLTALYLNRRYMVEKKRMHEWNRKENLENMPAHHFHNRGGVLIKKRFIGFEKYHANIEDMMGWYRKSNPTAFAHAK